MEGKQEQPDTQKRSDGAVMWVERFAQATLLGFGMTPSRDVVMIVPHHIWEGRSLLWICPVKHLDDDHVRAHRAFLLLEDGTVADFFDDGDEWKDVRNIALTSYAILTLRDTDG